MVWEENTEITTDAHDEVHEDIGEDAVYESQDVPRKFMQVTGVKWIRTRYPSVKIGVPKTM